MPPRDPPQPTGFPPVSPEESARAGAETPGSAASSGGRAISDAIAIVRRHRARIAAASAIAPEMRRVALDILDAVLDDLRSPREAGSRS